MVGATVRSPLLLSICIIIFTTFHINKNLESLNFTVQKRGDDSSRCALKKKLGTENQFPFLELISFPGSGNT